MKRLMMFCLVFLAAGTASASKITGAFNTPEGCSFVVYVKEVLPPFAGDKAIEQQLNVGVKKSFVMNLANKRAGFYTLSVVVEKGKDKSAYNTTIYLKPNDHLNLEFESRDKLWLKNNYEKIKSADNRALSGLNEKFNELFRQMYSGKAGLVEQKSSLGQLYVLTDSVLKDKKISAEVNKYLKFKAFDAYNTNLYRLALDGSRAAKENGGLGADFYKQPVDPLVYFNDPMLLLFPYGVSNVIRYLEVAAGMPVHRNRKTLDEIGQQITLLKAKVTQKVLVDEVIERMLDSYVTSYRMGGNFEEDLKDYLATTNQINDLATRGLARKKFENLRYTMEGAPLPGFKYEDVSGATVGLEQFKGKYLFIDLWASWCVPCIKMTPYVQQLEKHYEGKNINFVAISIDANKQSWLSKVKELNLHGHQYLDQGSAFAKALNVSGIPHYLIYDPEGKLVVYKTDMPNDPKLKTLIDQLPGIK